MRDFTTLLRMACNGKLINCLLREFSIYSFQAVVAMDGETADGGWGGVGHHYLL